VERFRDIKQQSTVESRDGMATQDHRRMEQAIARLRKLSTAASSHLPEKQYGHGGDGFRQTVDQLSRDVASRNLTKTQETVARLTVS
jgi:hypothetical protein